MKRASNIDSEMMLKNYERELKLCKKFGGDINRYHRLSFNVLQLEQIRLGLEHGIDTERYTDPSLSWMEMEEEGFERGMGKRDWEGKTGLGRLCLGCKINKQIKKVGFPKC